MKRVMFVSGQFVMFAAGVLAALFALLHVIFLARELGADSAAGVFAASHYGARVAGIGIGALFALVCFRAFARGCKSGNTSPSAAS